MSAKMTRLFRMSSTLLLLAAVGLGAAPLAFAQTQTKLACIGEATTHSAHRMHDPEYPQLMGQFLDPDFKLEAEPNPLDGGMLYGKGTGYRIGNFGLPTGTALDTTSTEVASTIHSPQLLAAEAFAPQVVVLGPYGPHEPYAEVSVPDNFAPDLKRLAQRILAFPSKPTVFMAIPIARYGEDTDTLRRQIKEWTVQVAEELQLPTIDLWTEFLGKRAEFYDQNHLALAGRERMGRFTGAAIKAWKDAGGDSSGVGGTGSGGTSNGGVSGLDAVGDGGTAGNAGVSSSAGQAGVGMLPPSGGQGTVGIGGVQNAAGGQVLAGAASGSPNAAASPVSGTSSCAVRAPGDGTAGSLALLLAASGTLCAARRRRRYLSSYRQPESAAAAGRQSAGRATGNQLSAARPHPLGLADRGTECWSTSRRRGS
jgi:hypothetical protein